MIRQWLGVIIFVAGTVLAGYVGVYLLFIKAILTVCAAYDDGNLTATLIGITIIKIALATTVSSIIMSITVAISKFVMDK